MPHTSTRYGCALKLDGARCVISSRNRRWSSCTSWALKAYAVRLLYTMFENASLLVDSSLAKARGLGTANFEVIIVR
eukprot:scaffold2069_cov254-Pinguiococcus_pyrenoidosus.AAC.5